MTAKMLRPIGEITDWDTYHRRVRISQHLLWVVWRAYVGLLRDIRFDRPIRIMELGCGTGYHTLQMTRRYDVAKVTLVDFNEAVIADSKRRMARVNCDKEFVLQDLFSLCHQERYDIVHSQGLLEHYTPEEQMKLIRQHRDLLAPGGIAVILVPTPSLPYRLWRGFLERFEMWIYPDETPLTREDFTQRLNASGLDVVKMQDCHLLEIGAVCRNGLGQGC